MTLLAVTENLPRRALSAGDRLLADGEPVDALYVLLEGTLRVTKDDVPIAAVRDPGSCVGEMSLLLGVGATADVVAETDAVVAVLDHASNVLAEQPDVTLAIARLLAARLQVMTSYLADLKQQYADHEGGLGMIDTVLGSLMQGSGSTTLGSDRDPDPEF